MTEYILTNDGVYAKIDGIDAKKALNSSVRYRANGRGWALLTFRTNKEATMPLKSGFKVPDGSYRWPYALSFTFGFELTHAKCPF